MAVAFNHLTTGGDTASNGAVYTTASVAPAANRTLFLAILANAPSGQVTVPPAITGLSGLTWQLTRQSPSTDTLRTLYWYRANVGSSAPTPAALTLNFGAQTLTICQWALYEASGVDTANPVVQSVEQRLQGGTNTSVSFPFDAALTAGNGTIAAIGTSVNAAITPGTGWTSPAQSNLASPTQSLMGMYSNSGATPVAASWTGGGNTWVVAIEVKAAVATPAPVVGAGADASITLGTTFTRLATETNSPTSRAWTVVSGPAQVGATLSTTTALSWTPGSVGTYALRYSATNVGGTGTDDVTITVTAALPTPGSILNIGAAANKNHFDVQIAPGSTGSIEQHTQAEIEAGFSDANHFYTTPDGLWVAFKPRADSVTTAGTTYGRDELREVNADGSLMKFDAMSGEHIMQGTTKIVHTPANDPDVVIAQLHDGNSDRIAIRTQMFSTGVTVLGVRINGTLHATRFQNPWVPGSSFTWKIRVYNAGAMDIFYNDMTTPIITMPTGTLIQTVDPAGWYWKAGAYNQFNETDAGATGLFVDPAEYSEVHLQALSVSHTAGPANLDRLRLGASTVGLRVGSNTPTSVYLGSTKVWP